MSVSAIVEDGKVTNMQSATSTSSTKSGTTMGKDDFLQLLVAQMKYQDPLEPTSNTEYVAQYAQFSQVEQMQNMATSMDLNRASYLVGQTVQVAATDENGMETVKMGKVDYVKYENGKAMVSIDEALYNLDDVSFICDNEYLTAVEKAKALVKNLMELPEVDKVSLTDKKDVEEVLNAYDDMNDYEKTFIAKSLKDKIEEYRERLEEVVKNAEALADKDNSDDETDTDKVSESENE